MIRRIDRPALLLAALGLLLALPILTYPMGRDQGMYANIAQAIRAGGLPFIDMWDIKPPAIYYLYALDISLFGASPAALRALDLIAAPLTLLALFHLTDAMAGRRAARWATLLFPVFYFTETFASLTQSDSLVTLPMTWAALCALRTGQAGAGSRRAVAWAFACGALCAVVMWFKHYYALFALALAVGHLIVRWRRRPHPRPPSPLGEGERIDKLSTHKKGSRGASPLRGVGQRPTFSLFIKEAAAFAAGGLAIGLPPLLYFASNGVFNEMLIVAQGTAQYNAQAISSVQAFWDQMQNYVEYRWWHWGPLIVLAISYTFGDLVQLSVISLRQTPDDSVSEKREKNTHKLDSPLPRGEGLGVRARLSTHHSSLITYLWLLSALAFVIIQAKGFDTHWIPMLPPLVILASAALDRWLSLPRDGRWKLALSAVGVLLFAGILAKDTWLRAWPYLTGQIGQRAYSGLFQAGDLRGDDSLRMARWLIQRTQPGDSVYIWGFRPEVAFMAGLRPATRFQAQFMLVGDRYPQAWKQENIDTLWAALPEYVLVVRADEMPWVTGTSKDSNTILAEDYRELRSWLEVNYERHTEIGNFLIWKRRGDA